MNDFDEWLRNNKRYHPRAFIQDSALEDLAELAEVLNQ